MWIIDTYCILLAGKYYMGNTSVFIKHGWSTLFQRVYIGLIQKLDSYDSLVVCPFSSFRRYSHDIIFFEFICNNKIKSWQKRSFLLKREYALRNYWYRLTYDWWIRQVRNATYNINLSRVRNVSFRSIITFFFLFSNWMGHLESN